VLDDDVHERNRTASLVVRGEKRPYTRTVTTTLIPVTAAPPGHRYRRVVVERFGGAAGAVISGVDLATDLDDDTVAEIRRAILDHHVVFFRGQRLDPTQQVAFSRRFGPYSPVPFIEPVADHPEVIAVIREAEERQRFTFGSLWHSDFSFLPEPPFGSVLYALEVPPYGGDTLWANQHLAFETLSSGMQTMLRALVGVHSARDGYSTKMQAVHDVFKGMKVQTSDEALREQRHPMVRTHPETGREALFANQQYTIGIDGWYAHEQRPLFEWLFAHATQDAFTVRWHWEVGDLAFWDNRCLQHMAMADFEGHRRSMTRTTVAGDIPR
jgi:taurine dioxygenase